MMEINQENVLKISTQILSHRIRQNLYRKRGWMIQQNVVCQDGFHFFCALGDVHVWSNCAHACGNSMQFLAQSDENADWFCGGFWHI